MENGEFVRERRTATDIDGWEGARVSNEEKEKHI